MADPNYPNKPWKDVNPNNEKTGHFTGRCGKCGSNNLWDDNLAYGCNNCGAFYGADSNPAPRLVPNRRG
jgi:uncharacterized protein (DUF983 family)